MIYIGIDPAYAKPTAIAVQYMDVVNFILVDSYCWHKTRGQLLELNLPSDEEVLCTIEGQEVYSQSSVKPEVILELANRSGFFEGVVRSIWDDCQVLRPTPRKWKGQVPPRIFMNRIIKKFPSLNFPKSVQEKEDTCHALGLLEWGKKWQKKDWNTP